MRLNLNGFTFSLSCWDGRELEWPAGGTEAHAVFPYVRAPQFLHYLELPGCSWKHRAGYRFVNSFFFFFFFYFIVLFYFFGHTMWLEGS